LNCLFPLTRLLELEQAGEIGASTEQHYSIMGYLLKPETMLQKTVPAIIRDLRADQADVVVLVPAWPICCWSVGLAQREIEAAGFSTIILTPVPEVALAVSAPRIAAIEYPLGRTLGRPGDAAGQLSVLRATLDALEDIQTPGGIVHLPFEWVNLPGEKMSEPPAPPPIVGYILRHPWQLPRLLNRDVPE
jgi:hypothetical protein